jgi:hypothetical protein
MYILPCGKGECAYKTEEFYLDPSVAVARAMRIVIDSPSSNKL